MRLAALLHDIGKPAALIVDDSGQRTFHGHDLQSALQAQSVLRRLRYPNAMIDAVTHLIRQHMFNYTSDWTDAAVRRFLARVGTDSLEDLFLLRKADSDAQQGRRTDSPGLSELRARISAALNEKHALNRKDLAVNGNDLLAAGVPPGPKIGVVIDHLFETVLDDPEQNTRDRLLEIGLRFYRSRLVEE